MTMTRDDVLSRRSSQPPSAEKRESADEIARQVERFLRTGGRIEHVPIGATGYRHAGKPNLTLVLDSQRRNDSARSRVHPRADKLSVRAAAKLAGMKLDEFRSLVMARQGPRSPSTGREIWFTEATVREWVERRAAVDANISGAMQGLRGRASP